MANGAYQRASLILQKAKGPKWKRELVSDHKFDFMDTDSFRERTCLLTIRYLMLLCSVAVSTLVYSADLWSAGILLIYDVKQLIHETIICIKKSNFLRLNIVYSIGHFQYSQKFLSKSVNGYSLGVLFFHLCY